MGQGPVLEEAEADHACPCGVRGCSVLATRLVEPRRDFDGVVASGRSIVGGFSWSFDVADIPSGVDSNALGLDQPAAPASLVLRGPCTDPPDDL